ncbi:hypothetical protein AB5I41_03435 [Sphingomonas sp. MMS24-JH45]
MTAATHPDPAAAVLAAVPADVTVALHDGLSEAIDAVAAAGPESHRFLRRQCMPPRSRPGTAARRGPCWRASRECRHWHCRWSRSGRARSASRACRDAIGPSAAWQAYPPPLLLADLLAAALALLASAVRGVRIGPYDGDPGVEALVEADAVAAGHRLAPRRDELPARHGGVAGGGAMAARVDPAQEPLPREAPRRPRRARLALRGKGRLARRVRHDGRRRAEELARRAHRWTRCQVHAMGPWRVLPAPPRTPAIAAMFHAALLTVEGRPAAFSFDIDAGALKYAVANSYVIASRSTRRQAALLPQPGRGTRSRHRGGRLGARGTAATRA